MGDGWDYIVVGAGSAGAVIAARLSEDSSAAVLLLEAGRDYRSADTPELFRNRSLGAGLATGQSDHDEDQEFFWGGIRARRNSHQVEVPYRAGRGLGGSSTINGLVAVRGLPEDFSRWVNAGASGWSYQEILDGFRKLEDDIEYPNPPYHGYGGPIPIFREPEATWGTIDRALGEAAADAGYPWMDDVNAPNTTGLSRLAMNVRDGRRISTNDGYLDTIRDRPNLMIRGGAHVDMVLLHNNRAVGVMLADGNAISLNSGGTVILSAGAVHSPAILMRSGIGPARLLAGLDIQTKADLPVGEGAQDHPIVFVELPVDRSVLEGVTSRTSVILRYTSGLNDSGRNDMALPAANHKYWFGRQTAGVDIQMNQCFSRGKLSIVSGDPYAEPHIELNLLQDGRDLARMKDGVQQLTNLMQHPAFTAVAAGEPLAPSSTDEVLRSARDMMHICSTARMGAPDDPSAVVTPDCQVLGIDGLHVIDASIMPEIVRGNINLTVIAMAELAVARLRGKYASQANAPQSSAVANDVSA